MSNLSKLGFKKASGTIRPRLIIGVQGDEGTGKNHFAMSAPDPIAVMSTDRGLEGMVEKFVKEGKDIWVKEYPKPKTIGDLNDPDVVNQSVAESEAFMAAWQEDYVELMDAGARTVVWDTGTDLWQQLTWARSGRMEKIHPYAYGKFNEEFGRMIDLSHGSSCNLIILFKQKDEYVNDSRTGGRVRKGCSEAGYMVQLDFTTMREGDNFEFYIDKCRANPDLQDETIPAMDFQSLAMLVYPDSDPEDWA